MESRASKLSTASLLHSDYSTRILTEARQIFGRSSRILFGLLTYCRRWTLCRGSGATGTIRDNRGFDWFATKQQPNGTWELRIVRGADKALPLWLSFAICRVVKSFCDSDRGFPENRF